MRNRKVEIIPPTMLKQEIMYNKIPEKFRVLAY